MGLSVSGTIDKKTYLKNVGVFSPLSPPWIRLWVCLSRVWHPVNYKNKSLLFSALYPSSQKQADFVNMFDPITSYSSYGPGITWPLLTFANVKK